MKKPHVVIVGGGFGGLSTTKKLMKKNLCKITLIDKRNYHLFQPLLYQVAMAGLSPAEIAYPLRGLLKHPSVQILLGTVSKINKEERWVQTESNRIEYDFLILACGSTYTYFNSPAWETFAPALKTIQQATEIRRKVFLAFELAERASDPSIHHKYMTFVIVGGGPTGVELAGSIGEITRYSIPKDFKNINPYETKIILLEAGPKILSTLSSHLQEEAKRQLEDLGVEIKVNAKVLNINNDGITTANEFIPAGTVLWAAGVAPNPLNKELNVQSDRQGRIVVNKDLSVPNYPNIFVIGDQAYYKWGPEGQPLPGLAPVAMQEGRFVAKLITAKILNRKQPAFFKYKDKGQMATIGRSKAVATFKGLEFSGLIAWMAWLLVHIYYLIGFRNRLFVLFQWAWTYFTFRRGARLIIEKE